MQSSKVYRGLPANWSSHLFPFDKSTQLILEIVEGYKRLYRAYLGNTGIIEGYNVSGPEIRRHKTGRWAQQFFMNWMEVESELCPIRVLWSHTIIWDMGN